jgi:SAM-dependent methyltransferase
MREKLKAMVRRADAFYTKCYGMICGEPPHLRPWHFQWHAIRELNRDLAELLPDLRGRVLDLGCGLQPYRDLLHEQVEVEGADVADVPGVDKVLEPGAPLPYADAEFDGVMSTQVFEHVADLESFVSEVLRVLKPGGTLVVSVPFIYQMHGRPHDYRRLSEFGLEQALQGFQIETMRREGAIGSTLAVLLLGWVNTQLGANVFTWACKALLLPLWIPGCLLVNGLAWLLDCMDTTASFYGNLLVKARRR